MRGRRRAKRRRRHVFHSSEPTVKTRQGKRRPDTTRRCYFRCTSRTRKTACLHRMTLSRRNQGRWDWLNDKKCLLVGTPNPYHDKMLMASQCLCSTIKFHIRPEPRYNADVGGISSVPAFKWNRHSSNHWFPAIMYKQIFTTYTWIKLLWKICTHSFSIMCSSCNCGRAKSSK